MTRDLAQCRAMGDDAFWAARFPALFDARYVDYAGSHVRGTTDPVPDHLVARLHLVGVTPGGEVVVCRSSQGWRFLPGGTREPGETLADLAARELREEAGAVLDRPAQRFAALRSDSTRARPYRPHLPYPRAYWAYAVAPVRVVGPPTNPADGETVVEVLALPVGEAVGYLAEHDAVHADVLRLADAMGLVRAALDQGGEAGRRRVPEELPDDG